MRTKPKWTAADIIRNVLEMNRGRWLPTHEICNIARRNEEYVSDNAAASRLSEMALAGIVEGRFREKTKYKEWRLVVPLRCRVCGCTYEKPCPGGCSWARHDLCSACMVIIKKNGIYT